MQFFLIYQLSTVTMNIHYLYELVNYFQKVAEDKPCPLNMNSFNF